MLSLTDRTGQDRRGQERRREERRGSYKILKQFYQILSVEKFPQLQLLLITERNGAE